VVITPYANSTEVSAYLEKTARGSIVNEQALLAALDAGWIQGAAFDVLEVESPSQDNKLLNHEKVILTPHTAANTDEAMSSMAVMAAEVILKVFNGEPPLNVINPEIYL
jgi:D-3-phosphoglycerate dehydrogenase